jgi:hypothetical protein
MEISNLTKAQKEQLAIIEKIETQVKEYPYCISWFHTSTISYKGNKSKKQFFKAEDKDKAHKAWFNLSSKQNNNEPYQQGYISYLTKNF